MRAARLWNVARSGVPSLAADERDDAVVHLARGLVGERDAQDPVGPDLVGDQVRDAAGDDARLAGAGARDDAERPVDDRDGGRLLGIESSDGGPSRLMPGRARSRHLSSSLFFFSSSSFFGFSTLRDARGSTRPSARPRAGS